MFFNSTQLSQRWNYNISRTITYFIFTFGAYLLYTKYILHLQLRDFKITLKLKLWNVICAIILPSFVICIFIFIGNVSVTSNLSLRMKMAIILFAAFTSTVSGILEEMLFRGYIMKLLESRWNKYIAIITPSFLFSLIHIPRMNNIDIIGLLLLIISGTLVGIMFSLIAYSSDSISGSAIIHAVWNCIMITDIIHFLTGRAVKGTSIFSITLPKDSVLITGGGFGIESSLPAIIGYALISIYVLYSMKKKEIN